MRYKGTIDRESADCARRMFEFWIPKLAPRRAALTCLARSIEQARSVNGDSWRITLKAEYIRLNVGMVEALVFSARDDVSLAKILVRDTTGGGATVAFLESYNVVPFVYGYEPPSCGLYESVSGSVGAYLSVANLAALYDVLQPAHIDYIEHAARTPLNPSIDRAHSPGVVAYLNQQLGLSLPTLASWKSRRVAQPVDLSCAHVGATVTVRYVGETDDETYTITDAATVARRISPVSALGAALLGHPIGTTVEFTVRDNVQRVKLLDLKPASAAA